MPGFSRRGLEQVAASAREIVESVDLAYTSLTATGKDPRKSPKWFKRGEIETRDLLRRLSSFQDQMSFDDRPLLGSGEDGYRYERNRVIRP